MPGEPRDAGRWMRNDHTPRKNLRTGDSAVRGRSRRVAREHGQLGMIMVDYLQLMQVPGSSEGRTAEISEISRILKAIAQDAAARLAHGSAPRLVLDLNLLIPSDSGWHLINATSINNRGEIVGEGYLPNGQSHAYLLTPLVDADNEDVWVDSQ